MTSDASVRELLKSHDLRYSRPREAILSYMREGHSHLSAEALYLALKQRGEDLSLSTVYLNLGVLTEAGLIREFRGASGESLYDRNVSPHYHLICNVSGEVRDVPPLLIEGVPLGRFLKEKIEAATGWIVDEPQLHLRGMSPLASADAGHPAAASAPDVGDVGDDGDGGQEDGDALHAEGATR